MSFIKSITTSELAPEGSLMQRRSEGRMKTYSSASDARAWCDNEEARRRYILDIVRHDRNKFDPIPIQDIVSLLRESNKGDCKALQEENERLKRLLEGQNSNAGDKLKENVGDQCATTLPVLIVGTRDVSIQTETKNMGKSSCEEIVCSEKSITVSSTSKVYSESACQCDIEDPHTDLIQSREIPNTDPGNNFSEQEQETSSKDSPLSTKFACVEKQDCSCNTADEIYFNNSITEVTSINSLAQKEIICRCSNEDKPEKTSITMAQKVEICSCSNDDKPSKLDNKESPFVKSSSSSIRKLVELELQLLARKKNTKQNMDKLKMAFCCLKRELDIEKTKNNTLESAIRQNAINIENLTLENACIKRENSREKNKIMELMRSLDNIFQEHSIGCVCEGIKDEGQKLRQSIENVKSLSNRLQELEKEVAEYKSLLNNQKDEYEKLLRKMKHDEEYKNRFEELAIKTMQSKEELSYKISQTRTSLNSMAQKVMMYEKTIEEQGGREKSAINTISSLQEELKKSLTALEIFRENQKSVEEENSVLKMTMLEVQDAAKENLTKIEHEKQLLSEVSSQYEKSYNDLTKITSSQEETIEKLKDELNQLKEKIAIVSPGGDFIEIDQMKEEITLLKVEIQRLNEEMEEQQKYHENEIDNMKRKLLELEEERKNVSDAMAEKSNVLEETIKELGEVNQNLIDRIAQLEDDHLKEISALKEENENLTKKAELVEANQNKLETENEDLKTEIDQLKSQLKENQIKIEEDLTKIKILEEERNDLIETNKSQKLKDDEECLEYKNQVAALNAENNEIKSTMAAKEEELRLIKESTPAIIEDCTDKQKNINDLLKEIKSKDDTIAELLESLEKFNAGDDNVTSITHNLEKQLVQLQKFSGELDVPQTSFEIKTIVDELTTRLEAEELRNSELEEALRKSLVCKAHNDVEERMSELETENRNLKKALQQSSTEMSLTDLIKRREECNNLITVLKEQYDKSFKNLLTPTDQQAIERIFKSGLLENGSMKNALHRVSQCEKGGNKAKQSLSLRSSSTTKTITPKVATKFENNVQEVTQYRGSGPVVPHYFGMNPEEAIKRVTKITQLENILSAKEQRTREKIQKLLSNVEKFKSQLEIEKKKKSELLKKYDEYQSKLVTNANNKRLSYVKLWSTPTKGRSMDSGKFGVSQGSRNVIARMH